MTKNKASPDEIKIIRGGLGILGFIFIMGGGAVIFLIVFFLVKIIGAAIAIIGVVIFVGNWLTWFVNLVAMLPFVKPLVQIVQNILDYLQKPLPERPTEFYIIYSNERVNTSYSVFTSIIKPGLEEIYHCRVNSHCWSKGENLQNIIDNAGPDTFIFFVLSRQFWNQLKQDSGNLVNQLKSIADANDRNRKGGAIFIEQMDYEVYTDKSLAFIKIDEQLTEGKVDEAKENIKAFVSHRYRRYKQPGQQPPSIPMESKQPQPSTTANHPIWEVPHDRNHNFIDRNDQSNLSSIRGKLTGESNILVLFGLNGVGKTEIARAFSHEYGTRNQRYQERYQYHWVMWVDASDGIEKGCRGLNSELDNPPYIQPMGNAGGNQPDDQELIKLCAWLSKYEDELPEGKKWLLIVDKCERDDFEKVKHKLKGFARGHIIYTMREDPEFGDINAHQVIGMNDNDGAELLVRKAKNKKREEISAQEWNEAIEVVRALGKNPLAIYSAGAYISNILTFQGYLEQYQSEKDILLKIPNIDQCIGADQLDESVATTFQVSFAKIQAGQHGAEEILLLCALLEFTKIPIGIVTSMPRKKGKSPFLLNSHILRDALGVLYKLSFISGEQGKTITLEKLVRDVIRAGYYPKVAHQLKEPEKKWYRNATVHAVSIALQQALSGKGPQSYLHLIRRLEYADLGELYLPHVFECYAKHIKEMKDDHIITLEAVQLLFVVGEYLREYPQHEKTYSLSAKELLEEARRLREQGLVDLQGRSVDDTVYPDVPTCCNSLAELYHERLQNGEVQFLEDAKALCKIAINILVTPNRTPSDHRNVDEATVRNNLGRLLDDTDGDETGSVGYEKAQEEFNTALTKREEVLSIVTEPMGKIALLLNKAAILNNLAGTYVKSGTAMLEAADQSANQHKHIDAVKRREKANTDFKVAEMRYYEASQILIQVKNLLPQNLDTALSLEKACSRQRKLYEEQVRANMATLYICWGGEERYGNAEKLYNDALDGLEDLKRQAQQQKEKRYEIEIYLQLAMQHNNLAELYRIRRPFNKAKAKECYGKTHHNYNNYAEARTVNQQVVFGRFHRMRFVIRDNDDELRHISGVMNIVEKNSYDDYRKLYLDI